MLVAGVSAFKVNVSPTTSSEILLRDWLEHDTFTWLITGEIVAEYGEVLRRLNVKPALIRTIIRLLPDGNVTCDVWMAERGSVGISFRSG